MNVNRKLSGIFYRHKNEETEKWENWCFEDLPEARQREIVRKSSAEWQENMIVMLSAVIRGIGEKLNLERHSPSSIEEVTSLGEDEAEPTPVELQHVTPSNI